MSLESELSDVKICLACSDGGHLNQMRCLSELYTQHDAFFLTEKTVITEGLEESERVYYLKLINRRMILFPIILVINFIKSLFVFFKEKPDVVISTGALSTIPIMVICKLSKKKLIFIESFAKRTSPTITGKFIYRFADLFIVQWEDMLDIYPNAIYGGSIY